VVSYLRRGGKAAVFYTLPPPLAVQMGFPSGKFTRAAQTPGGLAAVLPDQRRLPGVGPFRQQSAAFVAVNPDYSMRCPFFYRQSQRAANQPHSGYCDCEFFHLFTLS